MKINNRFKSAFTSSISNKRSFCEATLKILDKNFDSLERSRIPLPKREGLILYRDCLKLCRKFYWNNDDGQQWAIILKKALRKDFENGREITDTVEAGKKLIQGRQAIIQLEEKLAKVSFDISKFLADTRTDVRK